MWRMSAILIAPVIYVIVSYMVGYYVVGVTAMEVVVKQYAPMAAGFFAFALIIATGFR